MCSILYIFEEIKNWPLSNQRPNPVADLHSKILDVTTSPTPNLGSNSFDFMQVFGKKFAKIVCWRLSRGIGGYHIETLSMNTPPLGHSERSIEY